MSRWIRPFPHRFSAFPDPSLTFPRRFGSVCRPNSPHLKAALVRVALLVLGRQLVHLNCSGHAPPTATIYPLASFAIQAVFSPTQSSIVLLNLWQMRHFYSMLLQPQGGPDPQCSSTSATPRAHRDARLLSRVFSIVKFQLNAVRDARIRISFPSYRYIAVLCCRIGPLLRAPTFHGRSMETVAPSWGKNYSSFSTKLRLQINLCGPD